MKKLLLFAMAFMVGIAVMAQLKPAKLSSSLQNRAMPAPIAIDNSATFIQSGNPVVNTKSVMDEVMGNSLTYDMQSNASMMSRLYRFEDGTVAGAWTTSYISGNADRGSGYNYYNGTSWGAQPTARLETIRTGWPNINPWMGNGELNVAHNSTTSLVFNSRPVKGTGAWTQTLPLSSPTGITSLVWPRAITNGNNFQNIHIITVGQGNLGGQTAALLYYRSLDGGSTWDKMGVVLPGLDGTQYLAFGGDDYAWIEPHGDTIAFACAGSWTDTFLMYSYDNGNTWTKKIILPNYYGLTPLTTATPAFICGDGTVAGAMDKNGVFHIAFGRMRAAGDGAAHNYYPGTDGIVYWNSTLPVLDTAIITNIDSCIAHNICIGYVAANEAGDSILSPFPYYGVSLSSFPQVSIDEYNNIYFLWSSLTVGNPSPDPLNYRHIWGRAWYHGKPQWTDIKDLNSDIVYMFQEYAYPAVAKSIKNNKILLLTQTSPQPGSNIKDATIPIHEVFMEYREVPADYFVMVGVDNKEAPSSFVGKNYPNPVKNITNFDIKIAKAANVIVEVTNIMGQKVMTTNMGTVTSGGHKFTIDASQLTSGIYFYTVKIDNETYTQKMIVE
ncbi:MAG: T9SS type A sorting domain-containing protein [Bacteroidota bacterium]